MAHTKMYEPELNEAVRIVSENVFIHLDFDLADPLEIFVVAGIDGNLATMSEITDADGTQVTRTTLTGDGSSAINISGLTPNTFIAVTADLGDDDDDDDDTGLRIRILTSNPYGSEIR